MGFTKVIVACAILTFLYASVTCLPERDAKTQKMLENKKFQDDFEVKFIDELVKRRMIDPEMVKRYHMEKDATRNYAYESEMKDNMDGLGEDLYIAESGRSTDPRHFGGFAPNPDFTLNEGCYEKFKTCRSKCSFFSCSSCYSDIVACALKDLLESEDGSGM